jgi:2-polyprenyl-6-methoxyphenol hydroxylase-like FAD-dependent oxidoreductase
MPAHDYDVIVAGGGLGGSALAKVMADSGARVLVLEQEARFKDRVRGEFLPPWGVSEARRLGLEDTLRTCTLRVPYLEMGLGQARDLVATTPQALPALGLSHPEMQEALFQAAATAGAHVRREATVIALEPGKPPRVRVRNSGRAETLSARIVVASDGRNSAARKWAGFPVTLQTHPFLFAGVLLTGLAMPRDIAHYFFNPATATVVGVVYEGEERFRAYLAYPAEGMERLQGEQTLPRFLEYSRRTTAFPDFYDGPLRCIGPLASFTCDEDWVEHPYSNGVALIGDAAATSDPAYGQGMSLTLRDVWTLTQNLLSNSDWDGAGRDYATEHQRYFSVIHSSCEWLRQIFQEQGPEADRRRAAAMPLIQEDPTKIPDHIMSGPELPIDESVRARFFGEPAQGARQVGKLS